MIPSIKRAQASFLKAFEHVKQTAFHVLVEVRVREEVGKLKKKGMGHWALGMGVKKEATVVDEGADEVSSTPPQETNSSSAPDTLTPSTPNTLPPTPDVEPDPFPPLTRHNFLKHPIFWARFLGYAIPLSFLLYVLYLNYLPFGYHKTFTINVGSPDDMNASEFYLEPSKDLSDRINETNGTANRELNGMASAIFKPNINIKDTDITIEIIGEKGISLIPPLITFNPNSTTWDYNWDFTNGVPKELINTNNQAFAYGGGTYFDGSATRVELANSSELLEDSSLTIYVEWTPTDNTSEGQQIVGHSNWELWQNKKSVSFQVGRMNNADGQVYKISYPVNDNFFNNRHSALAVYKPSSNGFIELFIDGNFAGRTYFGSETIWKDYGGKSNLSFGWSSGDYGNRPHFTGEIYRVQIVKDDILPEPTKATLIGNDKNTLNIPIIANTTTTLNQIKINVFK